MFRSNTISTPVLVRLISLQAITVWSMAFSTSVISSSERNTRISRRFLLPSRSSIWRISGWNRMISARMPQSTTWLRIYLTARRSSAVDRPSASRKIATPFRIFSALVLLTSDSSLYTRKIMMAISTKSVTFRSVKYLPISSINASTLSIACSIPFRAQFCLYR